MIQPKYTARIRVPNSNTEMAIRTDKALTKRLPECRSDNK